MPEQKKNSKRAHQLVQGLTSEKHGRSSTIQDRSGNCLTEKQEILSRWTEFCSELYNHESSGDNALLYCSQPPEDDMQPILHKEVEVAVASLEKGKSAFYRVWHAAFWITIGKYSANLVRNIEQLYNKATSAVLMNGCMGEWITAIVGVRQGCLLSFTLFEIFSNGSCMMLWKNMMERLA